MSQHEVSLRWTHSQHDLVPNTYNRGHVIDFGYGIALPASAAASYHGDATKVDPEQMLVAALSSCHMLVFLALAEGHGYKVASYDESAVGILEKSDDGSMQITRVELSPKVTFEGDKRPDAATLDRLHHRAHKGCFIANSVKTKVVVKS